MKKCNKYCFVLIACLVFAVWMLNSVFASSQYDSRVYQVGSKYYNYPQEKQCCNYNYYNSHYGDFESNRYSRKYFYPSSRSDNYNLIHYTKTKSEKTKRGIFKDYVKEYSVEVINTGKTGRYFTVVFELEDKNNFEFTQSVTQYLRTGEIKKFVYRDIQYEKNEILNWDYTIIPEK